jgi:hypothetical protein
MNFREAGNMIRLGQKMLRVSYQIFQTQSSQTFLPTYRLRTAWPMIFTEFSDLVQGMALPTKVYYTGDEIRLANFICDKFSELPYTRLEKQITLCHALKHMTWRELATKFKISWQDCRKISDKVTMHLIQTTGFEFSSQIGSYSKRQKLIKIPAKAREREGPEVRRQHSMA